MAPSIFLGGSGKFIIRSDPTVVRPVSEKEQCKTKHSCLSHSVACLEQLYIEDKLLFSICIKSDCSITPNALQSDSFNGWVNELHSFRDKLFLMERSCLEETIREELKKSDLGSAFFCHTCTLGDRQIRL